MAAIITDFRILSQKKYENFLEVLCFSLSGNENKFFLNICLKMNIKIFQKWVYKSYLQLQFIVFFYFTKIRVSKVANYIYCVTSDYNYLCCACYNWINH